MLNHQKDVVIAHGASDKSTNDTFELGVKEVILIQSPAFAQKLA